MTTAAKTYFVSNNDLSLEMLKKYGKPLSPWNMDGVLGNIVSEEVYAKISKLLPSTEASNLAGILIAKFNPSESEDTIPDCSFKEYSTELNKAKRSDLEKVIKNTLKGYRMVFLNAKQGNNILNKVHALNKDEIKINTWQYDSTFFEDKMVRYSPPEKLFGLEVSCRDSMEIPKNYFKKAKDLTITDSDGNNVATFNYGNVFILHDIVEYNDAEARKILGFILEAAMALDKKLGRPRLDKIDEFIKISTHRITSAKTLLKKDLKLAEAQLNDTRITLAKHIKRHNDLMTALSKADNNPNEDIKNHILAELSSLNRTKHVTGFTIIPGYMSIHTDTLYFVDGEGTRRKLGKFTINIGTDSSEIYIRNHDVDTHSCQAPHVEGYGEELGGEACFGTISHAVADLHGKYRYASLAQLIISFLQTVNEGGSYCSSDDFPKA